MALIDTEKEFDELDILIYTSTIEAGVNYDKERFHKIYGVFIENTTSQRSFFQMLSRVRKFYCCDILILSEKLQYNQLKFFSFDEIKTNVLNSKFTDENSYDKTINKINGVLRETKKLNNYGINYIYNLLEQRNKHKSLFLYYFEVLAIHKGHNITIDINDEIETEDKKEIKELNLFKKSIKNTEIINADDINEDKFKNLIKKQNNHTLIEKEKNDLSKHFCKLKLGVDSLDDEIIDKYGNNNKIFNFINIIDIENYKKDGDDHKAFYEEKINIVQSLINDFGFKNVFDKKILNPDELQEKAEYIKENNELFKNNNIRCKFNKLKATNYFKTNKAFLGLINSIFDEYGFKIESKQIRNEKDRQYIYKIKIDNGIEEILYYKINNGFKLVDTHQIFNYKYDEKKAMFDHLIKNEVDEEEEEEEEETEGKKEEETNFYIPHCMLKFTPEQRKQIKKFKCYKKDHMKAIDLYLNKIKKQEKEEIEEPKEELILKLLKLEQQEINFVKQAYYNSWLDMQTHNKPIENEALYEYLDRKVNETYKTIGLIN